MLCTVCGTQNREAAKFCKGCGLRIADVAPSVPDAAWMITAPAPPADGGAASAPTRIAARPGRRRWALWGTVLLIAVAAAVVYGWRSAAPSASLPAQQGDAATLQSTPQAVSAQPEPAPVTDVIEATEPIETLSPLAPAVPPEATATVEPSASPARATRRPIKPAHAVSAPVQALPAPAAAPPPPAPVALPATPVALPSAQCAGRNFVAKALCMAEQCLKPTFRTTAECEAVRAQQRLEEEKRNPTAS